MSDERSWQTLARCRSEEPGVMQPDRATTEEVADALMVCTGCPVLEQCLQLGESQRTEDGVGTAYGVHGGLWFGENPVWEVEKVCAHEGCGETFRTEARGRRQQSYCSPRCRVAAYRSVTRDNLSA